jgi:DNA-binding winged helix-turn-helix (wHTH) protein/TolB-like protein/tetratricopeptide (TPR) repeat protein
MQTEPGKNVVYEFDSYELDPAERRLLRDGIAVSLPPKAFETLVVLVENNGHLVAKETLLDRVWSDSFVEEGNLKICIHTLRNALAGSSFIETIPKKGYRFNAAVKLVEKTEGNFVLEKRTVSSFTVTAGSDGEIEGTRKGLLTRKIVYLPAALLVLSVIGAGLYFARSQGRGMSTNPLAGVKTLAVLPLRSLSDPPTDAELRVGMADSIITKLSAVKQIAVRPTSSTIRYLDQTYDTVGVGQELKVDSVLEGSVQKEGQKLKINLQMVSVADGRVVWADSFTNDISNVLSGQESVANRVGRLMSVNLSSTSPENLAQRSPDPNAQELYLKGVYAVATSTRKIGNIVQARDFFEQAVRIDPDYAPAYAGLANTYTLAASLNLLSPGEAYPSAEKAARRALEIDPTLAAAQVALAEVESDYNWHWAESDSLHKQTLELAPNSTWAQQSYAEFLARMGRFEEAEYREDLAQQIDPTAINFQAVEALHLFYAHRFDDCIAQSKMVVDKDPNAYLAFLYLSMAESAKGNYAAAIEADEKAAAITGGAPPDLFVLGISYALMKDKAKTQDILRRLDTMSKAEYADPFYSAVIYALIGDKDIAFTYLEKCRTDRSYWISALKVFPFLDGLRSDPRFQDLLASSDLR